VHDSGELSLAVSRDTTSKGAPVLDPAADLLRLDYRPRLPTNRSRGIGIVGAGGIVRYAHLPAYRAAGFRVVGLTDLDAAKAAAVAAEVGIDRVYPDVAALLADPAVEIIDVAVYPGAQPAIVERSIGAGRHVLCQKPFALDYGTGLRMVEAAEAAGVKLAVNQQMRWDAGIRYSKLLVERGLLGTASYGTIQVHTQTDWSLWPWILASPRHELLYHSIHYQDSLRFLFGLPDRVYTSGARQPGESAAGETKTLTVWSYASGLQVLIDVNHATWTDDRYAVFRFEGTSGTIKGTIGLMYDYPHGRPDTLAYVARATPDRWHEPMLETRWVPDAFIGPMASLMGAIEEGGEPETSGRDNLLTLQTVLAGYRSMEEGREVGPGEVG
jgi:predicted dehydrogenase